MELNFEKGNGLIPAIIQHAATQKVLMLGYMNEVAFRKTSAERRVTFYSRSKQRLWTKGESSGNYLEVVDIEVDCDHDTLLILANPKGPVCHNGTETCFGDVDAKGFLYQLQSVISDRKEHPTQDSYTSKLFAKGINKIAQKVGEEATELVIEAKDNNPELFLNEAADLLYHILILLKEKGHSLEEVEARLKQRHR